MHRPHLWFACLLILPLSLSLTASEPWNMPADQRHELDALAEQAIALGLPDARGGSLFLGPLNITWAASKSTIISGLHVRLANGTWLINGCLRVDQRLATVDASGARALSPDALVAMVTGLGPVTLPIGNDQPSKAVVDLCAACSDGIQLITLNDTEPRKIGFQESWHGSGIAAATTVLALRCGVPGAERGAVGVARWAWMVDGDDRGLITPLGLGRSWQHALRDPPAPVEAVRRGLVAWFHRHVVGDLPAPFLSLPQAQAAAAMRALLPMEAVTERAEIDALLAQPHDIAITATLGERLAGYRAPPSEIESGNISYQLVETTLANWDRMTPQQREAIPAERRPMLAWLLTCRFESADLGQLIALAGDERPSRWLDRGHPRTVGDQALRLIADRLGFDPRAFTSRDPQAPWTASERRAVADELAVWWQANHARAATDLPFDALPRLSVREIARTLGVETAFRETPGDPAAQARLFDRLATMWAAGPPTGDTSFLDQVVVAGADHPAFAAVIDGWPLSGTLEWLLIPWHAGRGRRQHLDTQVQHQLDAAPAAGFPWADLFFVLPQRAVLAHLRLVLAGDVESTRFNDLCANLGMSGSELVRFARRGEALAGQQELAMRLILATQLVADRRPAPVAIRQQREQQEAWLEQVDTATKDQHTPLAGDLRVADVTAPILDSLLRSLATKQPYGVSSESAVDLHLPLAQRDEALQTLIDQLCDVLPPLLIEVGWADEIPGLKLPAIPGEILTVPF